MCLGGPAHAPAFPAQAPRPLVDFYFAFSAAPVTAWPALEISWPAPAVVLQADNSVAVASNATSVKAVAIRGMVFIPSESPCTMPGLAT